MRIDGKTVYCPKCKSEDISKRMLGNDEDASKISMDRVVLPESKIYQPVYRRVMYVLTCDSCGYEKCHAGHDKVLL